MAGWIVTVAGAVALSTCVTVGPAWSQATGATSEAARAAAQSLAEARRDVWSPGEVRAIRRWTVRGAEAPLPNEAGLTPDAAWTTHDSWGDPFDLGGLAPGAHAYATTTIQRVATGSAELAVTARRPVRVWVNGEPAGEAGGGGEVRLPVRLNAGANRILLRMDGAGDGHVVTRVLSTNQPQAATAGLSPGIAAEADQLTVRTDASVYDLPASVTITAAGGRIMGRAEVRRGEPAAFATQDWPDGPYEAHILTRDAFGTVVTGRASWIKGDQVEALGRVLAAGLRTAPGVDGDHRRLLTALIARRFGGSLVNLEQAPAAVHSILAESAELDMGPDAAVRPGGFVRLAWTDEVDGSTQFCRAYLPRDYDPAQVWPTVVNLHGLNPPNPPYEGFWGVDERYDATADRWNVIRLHPHGRANSQYVGIGERDVLRCLDEAARRLRVDPARVYLTGESMGGSGTWIIGSRHPERFAAIAPVFGGWDYRVLPGSPFHNPAADRPMERWMAEIHSSFVAMEQLNNTPIFTLHGDEDRAVPVDFTRYAVERLQRWGYDIRYREYPGWAHEDLGHFDAVTGWFLEHRLAETPRTVRIRAPRLDGAAAWWVKVTSARHPMTLIEADAEFVEPGLLRLDTRNVAVAVLTPPVALAPRGQRLRVVWNGRALEASSGPDGAFVLRTADARPDVQTKRAGVEGGFSSLFASPFVIVVGTASADPAMNAALAEKGEQLAGAWRAWQHQPPRLVRDTDLTDADTRNLSLVLVGGPSENAVSARMAAALPLKVTTDSITLDGRRFDTRDAVAEMVRPHPSNPERQLMVIAPTSIVGLGHWQPTYWVPVIGAPTNHFDWIIRDRPDRTLEPGLGTDRLWLASGVFNSEWRRDDRWTFMGDAALRNASAP